MLMLMLKTVMGGHRSCLAAQNGHGAVVRLLIERNDVDVKDTPHVSSSGWA